MVTLLFQRQGQAGLEMVAGRDSTTQFAWGDTWVPVEPVEAAICVNIGDMLMRWSDDRLKSNFHRVRAPQPGEYQGPRYSIAYFNQCCRSTVIQGPGKTYEPITAEEFLKQALQRNYAALTKLREAEAAAAAAAAT